MRFNALTRRATLLGGFALTACAQSAIADQELNYTPPPDDPRFAAIEARIGGRVGVAAWNAGTDAWLHHRAGERFAMCSTFKWMLAAQMLWNADRDPRSLVSPTRFDRSDLLEYAPVAHARIGDAESAELTVEEMCEAIVVVSDNTCANVLLDLAFGPTGFSNFIRVMGGDHITRLDRTEPTLNEVPPGDERDTTTPEAMTSSLRRFLLTDTVLSERSREKLIGWMVASTTGRERLRAGLPSDWRVGDKTGTWNGTTNAANDVAICWPPGRAPIIIACYLSASTASPAERNAAHAEVARIVAEEWG
jgi:beta-lactamase class A